MRASKRGTWQRTVEVASFDPSLPLAHTGPIALTLCQVTLNRSVQQLASTKGVWRRLHPIRRRAPLHGNPLPSGLQGATISHQASRNALLGAVTTGVLGKLKGAATRLQEMRIRQQVYLNTPSRAPTTVEATVLADINKGAMERYSLFILLSTPGGGVRVRL